MDKKTWTFVFCALAAALALSAFVSPFASQLPDGLDKFIEEQKLQVAEGGWPHAPFPDYKVGVIKSEGLSTAVSGIIGTLAVFGLSFGLARLVFRLRRFRVPVSGDTIPIAAQSGHVPGNCGRIKGR
jgi:cobalt/nickel transport protein